MSNRGSYLNIRPSSLQSLLTYIVKYFLQITILNIAQCIGRLESNVHDFTPQTKKRLKQNTLSTAFVKCLLLSKLTSRQTVYERQPNKVIYFIPQSFTKLLKDRKCLSGGIVSVLESVLWFSWKNTGKQGKLFQNKSNSS